MNNREKFHFVHRLHRLTQIVFYCVGVFQKICENLWIKNCVVRLWNKSNRPFSVFYGGTQPIGLKVCNFATPFHAKCIVLHWREQPSQVGRLDSFAPILVFQDSHKVSLKFLFLARFLLPLDAGEGVRLTRAVLRQLSGWELLIVNGKVGNFSYFMKNARKTSNFRIYFVRMGWYNDRVIGGIIRIFVPTNNPKDLRVFS